MKQSEGTYGQGKIFFASNGEHEDIDLEIGMKLEDWVEDENRRKPYRAISNVTILDIRRVAYAKLAL
jgi:Uma2 family endonuclease